MTLVGISGGIVLIGFIFARCANKVRGLSGGEGAMTTRPIRFLREGVKIKRAEGRQPSHPVFGETASPVHSSELAAQMILRGERAGLLTSGLFSSPAFPSLFG
jgi:hypothetical protein